MPKISSVVDGGGEIKISYPITTTTMTKGHGCQMTIARFLDRMCLALRASELWLRYATLQNLIPQILPSGNLAEGRIPKKKENRDHRSATGGTLEAVIKFRYQIPGGSSLRLLESPRRSQACRLSIRERGGSRPLQNEMKTSDRNILYLGSYIMCMRLS